MLNNESKNDLFIFDNDKRTEKKSIKGDIE